MTTIVDKDRSRRIMFSRGADTYDNAPSQLAVDNFDDFEVAVLSDRSPRKGQTFICAPLGRGLHSEKPDRYPGTNHWRLRDLVQPRLFLAFDFDGFADAGTFASTLAYLARFRGFGYTTASHTPQAPRARAILSLSRAVTRDEGIRLAEVLQAAMVSDLGTDAIKFDGSVYRGEQPIYTPVTTSESFHFDGAVVVVDELLQTVPSRSHATSDFTTGAAVARNADLTAHTFIVPDLVRDGAGREKTLLAVAGHLRGKGLDQDTLERILLDYNQLHLEPPLDSATVLDRARRYPTVLAALPPNDDGVPEPAMLSATLPPVPRFPPKLLPPQLAEYVEDVAAQMSCPVDFPAIGAMVALASVIGSRVHCRPLPDGTWFVPAGAWGMVVSPPGAIKSPPLSEMLKPLHALDRKAVAKYAGAMEQYNILKQIYDNAIKAAVKSGTAPTGLVAPVEPTMSRYIANDSTYEMLVAIAAANPYGVLIWRDELVGWFQSLNKENQKEARGLYLTGWSGTESYATDRIGRGHVRADCVNLSLLGTIQPNVLRQIVHDAIAGGAGDDGLVPRLQLAVYPDPVAQFVQFVGLPNFGARQQYENLIHLLAALDPVAVGASVTADGIAYLPFDDAAQAIHDAWRQALEDRIRAPETDEHPAMLAHLGKYRSLFPKLALILHLVAGNVGPICQGAALRARYWVAYLEAHAQRIYHTATNRVMQSAVALSNKIKAGRLADGFTKTDVLVKEWAGLRTADEVNNAITVLRDGNWLTIIEDRSTGGRPAERHYISPKVQRAV